MANLSVRMSCSDGVSVACVSGELDMATCPQLETVLAAIVESDAVAARVDLDDVSFLDSSAIAVLLRAHGALSKTGRALYVSRPQRLAGRVLALTGLTDVLMIVDTDVTPSSERTA